MNKSHLKGIYKVAFFCFALLIFDYLIGSGLSNLYSNQKGGVYYRTTYSLCTTNAEILVFGASPANHHYVPQVFEYRTGLDFYSTGRDGMSMLFFLAMQEGILKRYNPQIIILDINRNALFKKPDNIDRLNILLPYYGLCDGIDSIISLRSRFEKVKLQSKIYPYNSMLLTLLNNMQEDNSDRGFIKNDRVMDTILIRRIEFLRNKTETINEIDQKSVLVLKKFLSNCTQYHINVVVVLSPDLLARQYENVSLNTIREIVKMNNVRLLDFSTGRYMDEKMYPFYADPSHLNYQGAYYFSNDLCDSLFKLNFYR